MTKKHLTYPLTKVILRDTELNEINHYMRIVNRRLFGFAGDSDGRHESTSPTDKDSYQINKGEIYWYDDLGHKKPFARIKSINAGKNQHTDNVGSQHQLRSFSFTLIVNATGDSVPLKLDR